jgi:ATP-dependent DNA ligase
MLAAILQTDGDDERPPSGPLWVHEIKHDGYRLMVRRDGLRVRCFTRNGDNWADRSPAIVDAAPHQGRRRS